MSHRHRLSLAPCSLSPSSAEDALVPPRQAMRCRQTTHECHARGTLSSISCFHEIPLKASTASYDTFCTCRAQE